MKTFLHKSHFLSIVFLIANLFFASVAFGQATLTSDKEDYAPGTTATFTGNGFQLGETVTFLVLHYDGTSDSGADHQPWTVKDGSVEDLDGMVNGIIITTWHVCEDDCVGSTLIATADGIASGYHAAVVFTDAINISISATPLCVGTSVIFTTSTSGVTSPYQWRKNGFVIATTSVSTFSISSVATSDAGTYDVIAAKNGGGTVTSSNTVILTVNANPTLTGTGSSSTVVCTGGSATITLSGLLANTAQTINYTVGGTAGTQTATVTSNGSGVATFSTIALTTANNVQTITITLVTRTDVTPNCSLTPVSTNTATLPTVNPKPSVNNSPLTQTICSGGSTTLVTLTADVSGTTFAWTASAAAGVSGFTASGTGTIPVQTISATGTTQGTVIYAITPTAAGCPGAVTNYTVLVNPKPSVTNSPLTQSICSGGSTTLVTLTADVSGTTFAWTATATAGVSGFTASGTGTIPVQTISTTGTTQGTVTYAITPTAAGCPGAVTNYTVLVNPKPSVTNSPLTQSICSGGSTTLVTLTADVSGTTFAWTASATVGVSGFTASGTGTIPVQTISTTGITQGKVTYVITPTAAGCSGAVTNYTVLVNPKPSVTNSPLTQTICSGGNTTLVTLTSNVSGTTFAWTASATAGVLGFTASGTGTIPVQTISTAGTTQGTVTYAITPSAAGCTGAVANYTVLVNPTPNAVSTLPSQTICSASTITSIVLSGNVSGTVYNWTRDNTGNVTGIAASGSGNISGALTNTGSTPVTVTFTITPTANSCPGTAITATVLVNPTPTVTQPSNQIVCNNASTNAIIVSGAVIGTTFNWTNNTTSIGLAASGSGDITSFTATNTGATTVTASITVTPVANGCPGTAKTFSIIVNPTPTVNQPSNQTVCNNAATTAVTFSGAVSGTTFNWTNDNASIGLAASGSGNIAPFTATTSGTTAVAATITVAPVVNGCSGTAKTFTISVKPTPNVVATPSSQTICSGNAITTIVLSSNVSGTTYSWTSSTTGSVDIVPASGSGDISSVITNNTATIKTVTFTITPTANGCAGTPITATVIVNPTPNAVATPVTQTICSDTSITTIVLSSNVGSTVFNWTRDNTSNITGIAISGTGNISGIVSNTTATAQSTIFTIIPTIGGCAGPAITATVTVNKEPSFTICPLNILKNTDPGVCTAVVSYTSAATGTPSVTVTYAFTGATTGSGSGSGSGSTFNKGITNVTISAANTCGTASCSFTVIIADTENPTIVSLPVSIVKTNDTGVCGAVASWTAPTATDNCSATIAQTAGPASGSTFPLGSTTITYTATDASKNTHSDSFTVTVSDTEDPTIVSLPVSIVKTNDTGVCGAVASWTAPTAADNCSATIAQTAGPASGSTFPLGSTTITYTATDASKNTHSDSFTVT
ncbi:beta strand repeat-containing protein, partial [Flavobacterium sp. ZS1P70]